MKDLIKDLAEMAVDEAYGAHKYAKLAIQHKHDQPKMAEAVANMAMQELTHSETLLNSAKTILDSHPADDGMSYLFEYLHEKAMDESTATKVCLDKYRAMT